MGKSCIAIEENGLRLTARIGEAFTVCEVDEENQPDWVRIHPDLKRLPGGRLILSVNRDRDVHDAEMLMYDSEDGGYSWHELVNWPTSRQRGQHLSTACVTLGDGSVLVVCSSLVLATEEPGVFRMATWRSADGGSTWGDMEPARVELPTELGEAFDLYHPPHPEQKAALARWRKAQPPESVRAICGQLGWRRLITYFMSPLGLDNGRLLGFFYFAPRWGEPSIVVCVESDDGGHIWRYLSMPGPFDARFATDTFLAHEVDGLCEPSCARLPNGELLLVMRLGSRHPLYTVRSRDEGRTWVPDGERGAGCHYADRPCRPIAVYGILPSLVSVGGATLALCAGRPDATLSLSADGGYRWPLTWRFLEDNKPEDASTFNNTMLEVEPGRLLLLYDHGGYHQPPPEFKGPRRIAGHFIDVELTYF